MGLDNDGYPKDNYGRGGAALKLRMSNTVLSWGERRVKTPVFSSSGNRLLPETAWRVPHQQRVQCPENGRWAFHQSTDRNASSHNQGFVVNYSNGPKGSNAFDLAGLVYTPSKNLSASLYTSRYEDTWNQHYLGAVFSHALDENRSLSLNLNLYRTTDEGKTLSGNIDNTTWVAEHLCSGPAQFQRGLASESARQTLLTT